jgi:multiple sugar transport system ATP-binding protein
MRDGLVQQVGEPIELYSHPANRFVAGFIGSPAMNFAPVKLMRVSGALWAANDGLRIKVPEGAASRLAALGDREAILGIRPEDLRVARDGEALDMDIEAVVEVVERLGSEVLLDVSVGSGQMVAAVDPNVRTKIHDRLRLALNPECLHFFDPESEAAI